MRGGRSGVRSNNVQISIVASTAGSGRAGGVRWVGLLARVDAAADERDVEDDRRSAEEEEEEEESDDKEEDEENTLWRT